MQQYEDEFDEGDRYDKPGRGGGNGSGGRTLVCERPEDDQRERGEYERRGGRGSRGRPRPQEERGRRGGREREDQGADGDGDGGDGEGDGADWHAYYSVDHGDWYFSDLTSGQTVWVKPKGVEIEYEPMPVPVPVPVPASTSTPMTSEGLQPKSKYRSECESDRSREPIAYAREDEREPERDDGPDDGFNEYEHEYEQHERQGRRERHEQQRGAPRRTDSWEEETRPVESGGSKGGGVARTGKQVTSYTGGPSVDSGGDFPLTREDRLIGKKAEYEARLEVR